MKIKKNPLRSVFRLKKENGNLFSSYIKSAVKDLNPVEKTVCIIVFGLLFYGIFLHYTSFSQYLKYIAEDGLIEWLTFAALILISGVCLVRFFRLLRMRNWKFLTGLLALSFLFIFGAGEEISWGQRIFDIDSSGFFLNHNTQQETTLHNMIVCGVRMDRAVLSILAGIFLLFSLFILPRMYHRNERLRTRINKLGIPIPRPVHVIMIFLFFLIIQLFPAETKKSEIMEMGVMFIFLLIMLYPRNKHIYCSDWSGDRNPDPVSQETS